MILGRCLIAVLLPLTLGGCAMARAIEAPLSNSECTIYKQLSADKQYSMLVKAIDHVDEIKSLLNDSSSRLTFFAPSDKALRRPRHHHRRLSAAELERCDHYDDVMVSAALSLDVDHKCLKKILRAVLAYHILPAENDIHDLARNNTHPTKLVLPDEFGRRSLRVRINHHIIPPLTTVNYFVRILRPNWHASNGMIHGINHPLLPPPPIFHELFMFPNKFSVFTSAIQRTGLGDAMDIGYKHGEKGSLNGSFAATVFAPTNAAFRKLPWKLQRFLFSPFGTRVLRKLLQYHVIPNIVFHTDHCFNLTNSRDTPPNSPVHDLAHEDITFKNHGQRPFVVSPLPSDDQIEHRPYYKNIIFLDEKYVPRPKPIYSYETDLLTLLGNQTVHARIAKFELFLPIPGHKGPSRMFTRFIVNKQPVLASDIPSVNGAVHVINRLLNPRRHCRKSHNLADCDDEWEDWEDWLLQWAEDV